LLTWLRDQHGIVLALAQQRLRDRSRFGFASDHGVEFVLLRAFGQVDAVELEHVLGVVLLLLLSLWFRHALMSQSVKVVSKLN